jgi:hypothetical protein
MRPSSRPRAAKQRRLCHVWRARLRWLRVPRGLSTTWRCAARTTSGFSATSGFCPSTASPPPRPIRSGPRRDTRDRRVEKLVFVETKSVRQSDGTHKKVDLYARAGTIGIGILTADGDLAFSPLPRVRTHRNADKGGYRWYNDYRLPERLGGSIVTVRLHGNAEDAARRFNRTENVRPIPPDDPGFPELFRRRNDAESINRALEDTLWLGRAHSLGHRRQLLNLLGYAVMLNSLALSRHRRSVHFAA